MGHVTIYLLHKYYRLSRICDARYELIKPFVFILHSSFSGRIISKILPDFASFDFVWFRSVFRFVSFDFVSFRFDRFFVSFCLISFRFVRFRFVSFRSVSFRFYFVSYFTGTMCGEGYFGMNCTLRCYCKNGYCNSTSGVCHENKCKKGWTGEFCNEGNVLYS